VVTGDGDILMQLGALSTIAAKQPSNLSIVVMDNEVYHETGGQPTHTGIGTDLAAVATGCGFKASCVARTEQEVEELAREVFGKQGLLLAQVKIGRQQAPRVMPPRDGSYLKDRFRGALLGERAFE
jgi:thiamine pyrophosphate-dependent acetolactate synthase large subunit-like protein